jgi:hypothetical protein
LAQNSNPSSKFLGPKINASTIFRYEMKNWDVSVSNFSNRYVNKNFVISAIYRAAVLLKWKIRALPSVNGS